MRRGRDALTGEQRALLERWLPGHRVVRDHSWGLTGTTVLEVRHESARYIAKAGDDHHLARELRAHRLWLDPWTAEGRAPSLAYADDGAGLLVRPYVVGTLVEGTPDEFAVDTHRQAGRLLARLHGQSGSTDATFEDRANARALAWLDGPHRIAPEVVVRLRAEIAAWPSEPAVVVPTHGDWQPRNWLIHDGLVSVIDFGRADLRPAETDLARLASQQFLTHPACEAAFRDGYGGDPREPASWRRVSIREAIGTACWAHQVGTEPFEQQGLRMVDAALADP